jgi:hypothetical protein
VRDELVGVEGRVAGDVAEVGDVDPAVGEIRGGLLRQAWERVVAPCLAQRCPDPRLRCAVQGGLLAAVLLAYLAA